MPGKKTEGSIPVDSVKHKDKRVNIPTEELRDFVAEDEKAPKKVLYPRDPSLDPQLVWKGKDELDRQPLAVEAVPIYIQEKIHPQALIEDLRAQSKKGETEQLSLFADFNGIDFEQMVDFYRHEQNWSNRMILGDSLLVMTSLAEKEGLKGKVQMIYIDPPYGIKFGSNWQVSTRKRDVKDGKAEDLTRQPEQIKAFRDTWELGIHSYLTYLRDRLVVARELLSESGSVFVQIGDENVHLVRCILDEVFGSENFVSQIPFRRGGFQTSGFIPNTFDYILWYGKDRSSAKFHPLFLDIPVTEWFRDQQRWVEFEDGTTLTYDGSACPPSGVRVCSHRAAYSASGGRSSRFIVQLAGRDYLPPNGRGWSTNEAGFRRLSAAARLIGLGKSLRHKVYYHDFPLRVLTNGWFDTVTSGFGEDKVYAVQTASAILERCILMTTDPGDLVLDPTCGSGTTAYVAEQWGRRWITIDTSRVALALARTRLMTARYPYYLLADSLEGARKEAEIAGRPFVPPTTTEGDIKKGFVYKRVPHITLKSIANNEEIDAIHAKWQEQLEPLRAELNERRKQAWEEWQVPREPGEDWPEADKALLGQWWELRRERQKEIDESIARHADVELLYDQPYEDSKRVRVSGPFTVESLSPHRVLAPDEERPASETQKTPAAGQFELMIIDNLRKAGVQNTRRDERLKLDRLEPYAGVWLQAAGEYTDRDGLTRRVAVSIGPEHGTVGPEQVKEAAKEALRGVGFDLLVVCGFAFDAFAGETVKEFAPATGDGRGGASFGGRTPAAIAEETRQYGKLPIMLARMNPDLAMGDELLKKTGAGNLFMVFGEPDIDIQRQEGKIVLTIKGVDVYDPTTGQIRSSSTDDIACWFIDTSYNGESFFVRHAYFTGADQPYEKLKRALRAEIDEAAWASLYSTVSRPFDPPETGKIAVKVINHYGDEVMKVFAIGGKDGPTC